MCAICRQLLVLLPSLCDASASDPLLYCTVLYCTTVVSKIQFCTYLQHPPASTCPSLFIASSPQSTLRHLLGKSATSSNAVMLTTSPEDLGLWWCHIPLVSYLAPVAPVALWGDRGETLGSVLGVGREALKSCRLIGRPILVCPRMTQWRWLLRFGWRCSAAAAAAARVWSSLSLSLPLSGVALFGRMRLKDPFARILFSCSPLPSLI